MNFKERLEIISHYILDVIKDKLLVLENLKRTLLFLIIIFSLLLITLLDNKVPGEKIKDGDVTITTMIKNNKLVNDVNKQNYQTNTQTNNNTLTVNNVDNIIKNEIENINENKNKNDNDNEKDTIKTKEVTYNIININKADKNSLMTLSGIGEKMADRIIEYRNNHGEFKTIDELKKVSGIGDKKFNKIKKYIEV